LVYQTDKTLTEHRDSLSAEDIGAVETALTAAREALQGDDVTAMETARDNLTQASHKLAEAMYQKQAADAQNPAASHGEQATADASSKKDDDVVDAEYEDVN
jgi:molecular chaperone DnaK